MLYHSPKISIEQYISALYPRKQLCNSQLEEHEIFGALVSQYIYLTLENRASASFASPLREYKLASD